MLDFKFPLEVENGTIKLSEGREARIGQVQAYFYVQQGERPLEAKYGRVTSPQVSSSNLALLAELERLNAANYFDGVLIEGSRIAPRQLGFKVTVDQSQLLVTV